MILDCCMLIEMNIAVEFNSEFFRRAVEIEYILSDTMLTAEFTTVQF